MSDVLVLAEPASAAGCGQEGNMKIDQVGLAFAITIAFRALFTTLGYVSRGLSGS
jgi:hypothetical protein